MSAAESPDERIAALERRIEELEARVSAVPAFTPVERNVHQIVLMAAQAWGVEPADIYSERRLQLVAVPRQGVMWVARHTLPYSLPRLGVILGGRDHTTVLHGIRASDRRRARDPHFRSITDAMCRAVAKLQAHAEAEIEAAAGAPELQLEVAA